MIYKIVSSSAPIPEPIRNRFKSSGRAREYYNSRLALLDCLKEIHITEKIDELEMVDHHRLKKYPNILVSIAHTKEIGACFISDKDEHKSIGIDIELKSRIIKKDTSKFFLTKHDLNFTDLLDLWLKKEAAFKALSPLTTKEKFVLTDIWINHNKFGLIDDELSGEIIIYSKPHEDDELLIALAII